MKRKSEYFQGCLIGGAIGDALGWPVEFMRYSQIKGKYGKEGICDLVISSSGKAEVTDDTQMTIFIYRDNNIYSLIKLSYFKVLFRKIILERIFLNLNNEKKLDKMFDRH